jgi:hypothetical protein
VIGIEIDFRNSLLYVGESCGIIRVKKISHEEPGPGIAGARIRNQINVILKNSRTPARQLAPGENPLGVDERAQKARKIPYLHWIIKAF